MRRKKNPLKLTQKMIELVLTESYYTFKKLEERLNMLRRDMDNIEKSQIKHLDMKTKCHR